jgi:small-conductance mechanosensitive channel
MVAAFAIIIALALSKWIQHILRKRLLPRFKLDAGVEFALLRTVHYGVLLLGIYVGLATINVPMGAILGVFAVLGVGIGFGLQNLASNFISGIILLFERPVKVGDRITVDDVWGNVVQINLRTTVVNTVDNVSIIMPNSKLLENNLINWSYGDPRIRIRIPVGVAYGSDVDAVTKALLEAAKNVDYILSTPVPEAWFSGFGDSALDFTLVCWIPRPAVKENAIDQINRQIDTLFRRDEIEIPYPQRDLHIRTDCRRKE